MENHAEQELNNKSNKISLKKKIIIAIIASLVFYSFGTIYMPGFKGRVLDKETGEPIKDAYVICFTDYYPFCQIFNVGGPNSYHDTMQIAKTNESGHFRVMPYFKLSAGWVDYRRVYIFKEGYLYAKGYNQYYKSKRSLVREAVIYGPLDRKSINEVNDFHLSKFEADMDSKGNPFSNAFLGVLGNIEDFHDHIKYKNKTKYKRLKPFFIQLYTICNTYSEEIKRTFLKPHLVHNWEFQLKLFRDDLEIDKSRLKTYVGRKKLKTPPPPTAHGSVGSNP